MCSIPLAPSHGCSFSPTHSDTLTVQRSSSQTLYPLGSSVFTLVANLCENRSRVRGHDRIDVRFVDPHTGVFIDVTVLTQQPLVRGELAMIRQPNRHLSTRLLHRWIDDAFNLSNVFPLRRSIFLGISDILVPRDAEAVLDHWYGSSYRKDQSDAATWQSHGFRWNRTAAAPNIDSPNFPARDWVKHSHYTWTKGTE